MSKRSEAQSKRFIEAARKHETDERPEAFERAFAKIVPPKTVGDVTPPKSKKPDR